MKVWHVGCAGMLALTLPSCTRRQAESLQVTEPSPAGQFAPAAFGCAEAQPRETPIECEEWAVEMTDGKPNSWAARGRTVFDELCRTGRASSCAYAASAVDRGAGGARDPTLQQHYQDEACRLGRTTECRSNVVEQRVQEGIRRGAALDRCNNGDGASCVLYGAFLWDQDRNPDGLKFFQKACDLGYRSGCRRAGAARDALKEMGPW